MPGDAGFPPALQAWLNAVAKLNSVAKLTGELRRQGETVARFSRPPEPEAIDVEAMIDYEIEMRAAAHERALRWVNQTKGDPGRPGKVIPPETFWKIYELGLARAASTNGEPSLRGIAETTRRHPDLEYVPRDRVTPIADWIAGNKQRAKGYWERREIPPPFRAIVGS